MFLINLFSILLLLVSSLVAEVVIIPDTISGKKFKATTVTPSAYESNLRERFPVIFLLHGYSGNHTTWSKIAPLQLYADKYDVIFVCPDGDYNSWYIDSPIRPKSQFASYFINQVIPFIDSHYRTKTKPESRAIIGSSMGGYGALQILSRFPELFCGASSISGIMNLSEFPNEWDIDQVLGNLNTNAQQWNDYSIPFLISNLIGKDKIIVLDCGFSDFAIKGNRTTHNQLLEKEIAHEYWERPGVHNFSYPQKNIEYHILHFRKHFSR